MEDKDIVKSLRSAGSGRGRLFRLKTRQTRQSLRMKKHSCRFCGLLCDRVLVNRMWMWEEPFDCFLPLSSLWPGSTTPTKSLYSTLLLGFTVFSFYFFYSELFNSCHKNSTINDGEEPIFRGGRPDWPTSFSKNLSLPLGALQKTPRQGKTSF